MHDVTIVIDAFTLPAELKRHGTREAPAQIGAAFNRQGHGATAGFYWLFFDANRELMAWSDFASHDTDIGIMSDAERLSWDWLAAPTPDYPRAQRRVLRLVPRMTAADIGIE